MVRQTLWIAQTPRATTSTVARLYITHHILHCITLRNHINLPDVVLIQSRCRDSSLTLVCPSCWCTSSTSEQAHQIAQHIIPLLRFLDAKIHFIQLCFARFDRACFQPRNVLFVFLPQCIPCCSSCSFT